MDLKIYYLSVNDLKPYERNNKKHEKLDIDAIAKSIKKYGMNDPIGIWKDNIIVEGHGRFLACKQLGIETVPCIKLDHLNDKQRREYAILHNKTAELALYDFDNLKLELEDLDFSEFDNIDFSIKKTSDKQQIVLKETISVVINCQDEFEAEDIFEKLTSEGYKCHISTL